MTPKLPVTEALQGILSIMILRTPKIYHKKKITIKQGKPMAVNCQCINKAMRIPYIVSK